MHYIHYAIILTCRYNNPPLVRSIPKLDNPLIRLDSLGSNNMYIYYGGNSIQVYIKHPTLTLSVPDGGYSRNASCALT